MEPSDVHTDPDSPSLDNSNSSDPPLSTPSTSPTGTLPNTPSSTNIPLTIEDRLIQLQNTLAQINVERDSLTASLKSAKRDSQKADAALRSEIDILKRASEKHAAAEHRAKQKILSLQEAVKRAQTATRETEELIKEVQGVLPGMNRKRTEKEGAYNAVKEEADRVRKERDAEAEKGKKRLESMKNESATLSNKLEKLNGKKDKLETGIIPDLEEQLKEVEREVEKAEIDSYANIYAPLTDQLEPTTDDTSPGAPDSNLDHSHSPHCLPHTRIRHQTILAGTIARPSPAPIQRPPPSEAYLGHQPQLWSHPVSPRPSQALHQTHNHRSSSLHHQTPTLLINPRRRKSSATAPTQPQIQTGDPSSPTSQTGVTSATSAQTSTLCSRAPAFEPGRLMKTGSATTTTRLGASPMPIQRPSTAGATRGVYPRTTPTSHWAGHFESGRIG